MPTQDLQRWNQDGANMKAQLEAAGYEVDLQYANNDVATPAWKSETAQARMDNILSAYYADALTGGQTLDICLCSNDSTALGVTNYEALPIESGYYTAEEIAE